MCGIAGVIQQRDVDSTRAVVERMNAAQLHRGPDDGGVVAFAIPGGAVALGNRRLAIQDVSPHGHQPMKNADTGDILVYNGEIYNAPEVAAELRKHGFRFQGHSDTEVLLRAYELWGVDCLKRLNGMFAFAIWEDKRRRVILARDHLGIKPLYLGRLARGGVVFGSEVRGVLASGLLDGAICGRAVAGYLAYGAVQEPLTMIEGLGTLAAGCWVEISSKGEVSSSHRYWCYPEPDERTREVPQRTLYEEGRAMFESAVTRQLLSDVPLGVFLSSGLDSTAVLGAAARTCGHSIKAFTVAFPELSEDNEGPAAKETAERLGVEHRELVIESATAQQWAVRALSSMDQPTFDGVNAYMVSRAVREQGIVVALSGQGGDEVFGGYERTFRSVPKWLNWLKLFEPIDVRWREGVAGWGTAFSGSIAREKVRAVARCGAKREMLYFQVRRLLGDEGIAKLLGGNLREGLLETYQVPDWEGSPSPVPGDTIASLRRLETTYYLGNMLLRDGDVFGMANSLEVRVPMLDRELVEWAGRIPGDILVPKGRPLKHVLRQMCSRYLPTKHSGGRKRGFSVPFKLWLRGPLREVMDESLEGLKGVGLLRADGIDGVRDWYLGGAEDAAWSRVWALLALGHWLEQAKQWRVETR